MRAGAEKDCIHLYILVNVFPGIMSLNIEQNTLFLYIQKTTTTSLLTFEEKRKKAFQLGMHIHRALWNILTNNTNCSNLLRNYYVPGFFVLSIKLILITTL